MRTHVSHTYQFIAGGNAGAIQISGWSLAEPQHTWAVGARSVVAIDTVEAPFGFFLELDWQPFIAQPYRADQTVIISAGDYRIRPYRLAQREMAAFYFPPPEQADKKILITFEYPDATPANELLDTADTRATTVAFRRIRVMPLHEPVPNRLRNTAAVPAQLVEQRAVIQGRDRPFGIALPDLLRQFEMVAGNCDLGLSMRTLGLEQLSLLRFAGATPHVAVRGIETGFEGVGQDLSAEIADNPIKEWMIRDRYGLRFHTHQSSDVVPEADIIARQRRHIGFLRRKFLEDLELGEKIFVYADHIQPHSLESALPLFLALNRTRKVRMLWVCQNFGEMARHRVDEILPGLARGSLDCFAGPLEAGHIAVSGWVNVLLNAALVLNRRECEALIKPEATAAERIRTRQTLVRDVWHPARHGELAELLTEGWSSPEDWGAWGVGPVHRITLRTDATAAEPVAIDLDVHAFVWDEAEPRVVDIYVNDTLVTDVTFTKAKHHATLELAPLHAANRDGTLTIELRPRVSIAPKDILPNSSDSRTLGVGLHRIRVRAIAPEPVPA